MNKYIYCLIWCCFFIDAADLGHGFAIKPIAERKSIPLIHTIQAQTVQYSSTMYAPTLHELSYQGITHTEMEMSGVLQPFSFINEGTIFESFAVARFVHTSLLFKNNNW